MNIVDKARSISVPEWSINGPNGPLTVRTDPESGKPEKEVEPAPAPFPPDLDERVEWDTETAALVQWFEAAALPAEPFDLLPFVRVVNPTRFYRSLRTDIARGASGPRVRTGALRKDLCRLRCLVSAEATNHSLPSDISS